MFTIIQQRSSLSRMASLAKSAGSKVKINPFLLPSGSQEPGMRSTDFAKSFFHNTTSTRAEGPYDYGYDNNDEERFKKNKPTIQYAKSIPTRFSAMRHEQILQLCVEGSYSARREALIRNVMSVDEIEHEEARKIVTVMENDCIKKLKFGYIPYHVGFGAALSATVVSFPMIFDLNTVQWFNDKYVTAELPPLEDLETPLEVASTSWSWMEPIIGQVSFVLLLLQFARNQALNLGVKPYRDYIVNNRAEKLIAEYPQYDEVFIRWFVEGQSLYGPRYLS